MEGKSQASAEARRQGGHTSVLTPGSSRLVVNTEGSQNISMSKIHVKITFTLATGIKGIQLLFHFSQFSFRFLLSLFSRGFIFHKNPSSMEKF